MAMSERELQIIISAQDNASAKLQNLGKKVQDSFGKISAAAGLVGVAVGAFAATSVSSFVDAEKSSRQLEHAVIAVSNGTREQVDAILEVSNALQKKAGIDGDALAMGAAQLSTFGLQSESVVALTKSLADLTVNQSGLTAGSDDYVSSANVMAKALQGQFGALEKSGIRFTEAQQQMILYGSETEKVAALQEGLNQNLRETTDTIANTAEAGFAKLTQSLGDVQEAVGAALLPAIASLVEKVVPLVQKFSEWAMNNPQLISAIVGATLAVTGLLAAIGPLGAAIELAGLALANLPIVAVIASIVALGAILVICRDQVMAFYTSLQQQGIIEQVRTALNDLKNKIIELWDQFKQTGILDAFRNAIMLVWTALTESLWPALVQIWEALQPLLPLISMLAQFLGVLVVGAILIAITVIATLIQIIGGVISAIATFYKQLIEQAKPGIDLVTAALSAMKDGIVSAVQWFNTAIDTISSLISKIGELAKAASSGVMSGISGAISGVAKAISGKRALGGPVTRGHTYLVGENGPEYFTAPTGGSIVPNGRGGMGGGVSVGVNLSVGSVGSGVDVRRMAETVGDIILGKLQQNMGI